MCLFIFVWYMLLMKKGFVVLCCFVWINFKMVKEPISCFSVLNGLLTIADFVWSDGGGTWREGAWKRG
jgi:hypothetical protein